MRPSQRRNVKDTTVVAPHVRGCLALDESLTYIEVSCFQFGASASELVTFLKSKLPKPIPFSNVKMIAPRKLSFSVPSLKEANDLAAFSGTVFKTTPLKITVVSSALKRENAKRAISLENSLTQLVKASYLPGSKFLDLSSLQHKFTLDQVDLNTITMYSTLWLVARKECPQIETISLEGNNICSLAGFSLSAIIFLRDLKNFSLRNNSISEMSDLEHLRNARVRELDLRENPVSGLLNYRSEVERKFPHLRFLDGVEVKMLRSFNLPAFITTGVQLPECIPNYRDTSETSDAATSFMRRYFDAFDHSRDTLLGAYVDTSLFSVDTRGTPAEDIFGEMNRNLYFCPKDKQSPTLLHGTQQICRYLNSLPATTHSLANFTMDALWPGFRDHSFAFTRTFLLARNPNALSPGSWPQVIINDQLHFCSDPSMLVLKAPATGSPIMLAQLMQDTNLLECYALQCLQSAQWNHDAAMESFNRLKAQGKIPAEALNPCTAPNSLTTS
ncbi:TAP Cterminal subfamily protein [Pelomyxa schiedti]|nr:TAP Cterminal subfamily protein [Pelomyxa schiedti]